MNAPNKACSGRREPAAFWGFVYAQASACAYEVPPDGRFDLDLRWGVPPTHRTDVPAPTHRRGASTLRPTHDDRLLSAALIAELDRLLRAGDDPLDPMEF
jgi:hypothetical protein